MAKKSKKDRSQEDGSGYGPGVAPANGEPAALPGLGPPISSTADPDDGDLGGFPGLEQFQPLEAVVSGESSAPIGSDPLPPLSSDYFPPPDAEPVMLFEVGGG